LRVRGPFVGDGLAGIKDMELGAIVTDPC
jgi:hypothetical protein